MKGEIVGQGTVIIIVVAVIALIIGAAAGYILKVPEKPPEIAELEERIDTLEQTVSNQAETISDLQGELATIKEVVPGADLNMEPASFTWAVDTWLVFTPIHVAKELGYFEDEGLDVELIEFGMGAETMDSILEGRAELGVGAHYALCTRLGKGDIGLASFVTMFRVPQGFVVLDPDIKTWEDLKGKSVGAIQGTMWDYVNGKTWEKGGFTEEDVTIKSFVSMPDEIASIIKGDIVGAWVQSFAYLEAIDYGMHSLGELSDVADPGFVDGLGIIPCRKSWAEENPDVVARALRAYRRAAEFANTNPRAVAEIMEDRLGIPFEQAYQLGPTLIHYVALSEDYVETMKELFEWGVDIGYISEPYTDDFYGEMVEEPLLRVYPELVTHPEL